MNFQTSLNNDKTMKFTDIDTIWYLPPSFYADVENEDDFVEIKVEITTKAKDNDEDTEDEDTEDEDTEDEDKDTQHDEDEVEEEEEEQEEHKKEEEAGDEKNAEDIEEDDDESYCIFNINYLKF